MSANTLKALVPVLALAALCLSACAPPAPTEAEQQAVSRAYEWAVEADGLVTTAAGNASIQGFVGDESAAKLEAQATESIAAFKALVSNRPMGDALEGLPDRYSDVKLAWSSLWDEMFACFSDPDAMASYDGSELETFRKACLDAGFELPGER